MREQTRLLRDNKASIQLKVSKNEPVYSICEEINVNNADNIFRWTNEHKEQNSGPEQRVSKSILGTEGDEALCQHELPRDERWKTWLIHYLQKYFPSIWKQTP